jgi:hypothetical protein
MSSVCLLGPPIIVTRMNIQIIMITEHCTINGLFGLRLLAFATGLRPSSPRW